MLGALAFVALVGSAFLGAVMLVVGIVLSVTKVWRQFGVLILCAGALGSSIGALVLLGLEALLNAASQSPLEVWLLFGAAGFGWAGLLSAGAIAAIALYCLVIRRAGSIAREAPMPNRVPHRDGQEAAHFGQQSSAPARGRER